MSSNGPCSGWLIFAGWIWIILNACQRKLTKTLQFHHKRLDSDGLSCCLLKSYIMTHLNGWVAEETMNGNGQRAVFCNSLDVTESFSIAFVCYNIFNYPGASFCLLLNDISWIDSSVRLIGLPYIDACVYICVGGRLKKKKKRGELEISDGKFK